MTTDPTVQPQPLPPPTPLPVDPMRNPAIPAAVTAMLGGLLICFGSFLPWLTVTAPLVGTISRSGMDGGGDGTITLALGCITILLAVVGFTAKPKLLRLSILTGAVAGIVAVAAYQQVQDRIAKAQEAAGEVAGMLSASVGAGIWALLIGAVLAVVGGFLARKARR
jgi:hypothetical protein